MKIIALYLPQFHEIPENNEWWGNGFTEWTNIKSAEPQFEGHNQPRIPLNNNYYNLLDDNVKIWQAELAKKYGVYGFCYYHYWFEGKLLLEKPAEQMLANKKIKMPFSFCWANHQWSKQWTGENKILIPQTYGDIEDWKNHFNYLLPFFKDERYIKEDNMPFFTILNPQNIECLNNMLECWNDMAKENGFAGMCFSYLMNWYDVEKNHDESKFKYAIQPQPKTALVRYNQKTNNHRMLRKFVIPFFNFIEKKTGRNMKELFKTRLTSSKIEYDDMWELVLQEMPNSEKSIPGAFVDWDNTPRYKERGRVYANAHPDKFEKYLTQQIIRAKEIYKKDYIFMFAWNEWSEGGYLEPDEKFGYGYLKAIKNALLNTNELLCEENEN